MLLTPQTPDSPSFQVEQQRFGLDQVSQKYSLIRAVDSRHPQLAVCMVQPVQVAGYPVDGQTYKTRQQ